MNIAQFTVEEKRCIGCGLCTKTCPAGILHVGKRGKAEMDDITGFGWGGCWKCQHCLAICPMGAISILGKEPMNSLMPPKQEQAEMMLDALMTNRRSCRHFLNQNVDREVIDGMLAIMPAAPNGGNKMQVRYAVVDDRDKMKAIKERVYNAMLENAAAGRYPDGFDKSSFDDFMRDAGLGEGKTDIVFRGAPHMFIAHSPQGKGTWVQDVNIASTYFDLLCTSRGLGSIMMTFPLGALRATPGLLEELGIPEDHYIAMVVGFGKPMYLYTRGVQKDMEE